MDIIHPSYIIKVKKDAADALKKARNRITIITTSKIARANKPYKRRAK